jgi:hypothetical protein
MHLDGVSNGIDNASELNEPRHMAGYRDGE